MHRSYGIVDRASRSFVIVNARADDHRVDVILDRKPAGLISAHDYNEDFITRVLFNDGTPYKILQMGFTAIGRSLLMASLFNGTGSPEHNNLIAMKMASLVLRYESHLKDPFKTIENSVKVTRFGEENECEETCAICHDEYQAEDMIGTIICKHSFHPHCILAWMRKKGNCPICRAVAVVI